jgi:two-component system response regulator AtoC
VRDGRFRADLFYRLDVVHLRVPALRERPQDVPLLAASFARRFGLRQGRPDVRLDPGTLEVLAAWPWPGNVRELRNVVERMVVLSTGEILTPDLLPEELFHRPPPAGAREAAEGGEAPGTYREAVVECKRRILAKALDDAGGSHTRAAEALGMQRSFLSRLVKELGLREPRA